MKNYTQLIETKRKELIQLTKNRHLSDPVVVTLSQELDSLIYSFQLTKRGN